MIENPWREGKKKKKGGGGKGGKPDRISSCFRGERKERGKKKKTEKRGGKKEIPLYPPPSIQRQQELEEGLPKGEGEEGFLCAAFPLLPEEKERKKKKKFRSLSGFVGGKTRESAGARAAGFPLCGRSGKKEIQEGKGKGGKTRVGNP